MLLQMILIFIIAFAFWNQFCRKFSQIPLFLPNIFQLNRLSNKFLVNLLFEHLHKSNHEISKFFGGWKFILILKSPKLARITMKKCLDKSEMNGFVNLHQSLAFVDKKAWKSQHQLFLQFFKSSSVQKLIPLLEEKSEIFVERMEEQISEFNIIHPVASLTLETILKIMGLDVDLQHDEMSSLYFINLHR